MQITLKPETVRQIEELHKKAAEQDPLYKLTQMMIDSAPPQLLESDSFKELQKAREVNYAHIVESAISTLYDAAMESLKNKPLKLGDTGVKPTKGVH